MLEIIGWIGSALVVFSLTQARVLRFRVLNLIGAVLATGYNLALGIWPFAAMNGAIAVIDVYWLSRLLRQRHDAASYEVIRVSGSDAYLRHVVAVHAADIAAFYPAFDAALLAGEGAGAAGADAAGADGVVAFLVLRGDETVGVVVLRDVGDGVGQVELDYVTQRFRDFTPGEFVYRRSGIFADLGLRTVVAPHDAVGTHDYYQRVGFRRVDGTWSYQVPAAA